MPDIVDVNTGEIKIGKGNQILTCRALGSCIAVVLIDKNKIIGGIAHIMLSGSAPVSTTKCPTRYAENAIDSLLENLKKNGSSGNLIACIAGGGNVLKRSDDTICSSNIESVRKYLNKYQIPIVNSTTGGYERRSVTYNVSEKKVKYTLGDSDQLELFYA